MPPPHIACLRGKKPIVDARDVEARTALMLAARNGHLRCIEVLLDNGARPSREALGLAVRNEYHDVARILRWAISGGPPPMTPLVVEAPPDRPPPLPTPEEMLGLATSGSPSAVRRACERLGDAAADVLEAARDARGRAALHAAIGRQDKDAEEVLAVLAECGLNLHAEDAFGRSGLHHAAAADRVDAVRLLAFGGVKADSAPGATAMTPLMIAAKDGSELALLQLLRTASKALVDAVNADGHSALALACMGKHRACVKRLMKKNATVGVDTAERAEVLEWARAVSRAKYVEMLDLFGGGGADDSVEGATSGGGVPGDR